MTTRAPWEKPEAPPTEGWRLYVWVPKDEAAVYEGVLEICEAKGSPRSSVMRWLIALGLERAREEGLA